MLKTRTIVIAVPRDAAERLLASLPEALAFLRPYGVTEITAVSNNQVLTDEELLDAYRRGDTGAFAQVVERYQRELSHFLVRLLGDRSAAEDVFQETFLEVHQSADQFDPSRRFRPWLFTIAANRARDLMRSQARRPSNPLQPSISPGDEESAQFVDLTESAATATGGRLDMEELQRVGHTMVMVMPDDLREILLLSCFHQFSYKQISDILNIPLGTVKSRIHAAFATLADLTVERGSNAAGGENTPKEPPAVRQSRTTGGGGRLSADNGRAVDLYLATRAAEAEANVATNDANLQARSRTVAALFELLASLPVPEPPHDLCARTLARSAARRSAARPSVLWRAEGDSAGTGVDC